MKAKVKVTYFEHPVAMDAYSKMNGKRGGEPDVTKIQL